MGYNAAMDFLKSVTGKVVSAALGLAVIAGGISWWSMEADTRSMLISGTGRIVAWLLGVLLWPWATFFVIAWVAKVNRNSAGAMLVAAYTILEAALLVWLFGWSLPGGAAWTFAGVGVLFAAVYNVLACDWIAEKV